MAHGGDPYARPIRVRQGLIRRAGRHQQRVVRFDKRRRVIKLGGALRFDADDAGVAATRHDALKRIGRIWMLDRHALHADALTE